MSVVINGTSGITGNTGTLISASTIGVGGATPSASGAGITFPATQSASTDANTLDDYEEGTFSPTIAGTSSAGTGTYTTQTGKYTKIGNRVFFAIELVWTNHTGTGNMEVRGLPFTTGSMNTANYVRPDNMSLTAGNYVISFTYSGSTYIQLAQTPTGTVNANLIAMDTAANIMISGQYDAA